MTDKSILNNTVSQLLSRWREAEGKIRLYGPTMPQSRPVMEGFYHFLEEVFRTVASFSLVKTTRGVELMLHEKSPQTKPNQSVNGSEHITQIPQIFDKFKIQSITFKKGLTLAELEQFFCGLHMSKAEANQPNSLAHYLQANRVRHIELDQVRVKVLKDGAEDSAGQGSFSDDTQRALQDLLQQTQQPMTSGPKSFASVWESYLNDQMDASVFKTQHTKLLDLARSKPEILVRAVEHMAAKQERIEAFLANLEHKLFDVGFPEGVIARIKNKLLKPRQILIDEAELARLRQIEREYQPNLAQRIEQSLHEIDVLQRKLSDERERGDAIIRQSSQGIMVLNKAGQILELNATAEKVLGLTVREAQGKTLNDVIQDHHMLSVVSGWEQETDEHIPKQVEIKAGNEEVIDTIRESALVIEDENGRSIGGVSALHDVAQFKELERRKNDILDVLGHDLRAPLNIVKQNIDLIVDFIKQPESIPVEEQAQFLDACQRHIARMEKMINKILDVRQLETGKVVLKMDMVPTGRIIEDAAHSLDSWARDKRITITIQSDSLPELYCDPERLYQVVTNLISNALKFTPEDGGIQVTGATVDTDTGPALEVSVQDSGIGIQAEDLKRIFNKYEQVSLNQPKGVSGLGLGLSTCKAIIEMHNGTIWADSVIGQGSTFTFRIPIQSEPDSA